MEVPGNLEHMLVVCPGLQTTRHRLRLMFLEKTSPLVPLQNIVQYMLESAPEHQLQFVLDHFVYEEVRVLVSVYGQTVKDILSYCSRTYVYYLYREKCRILGEWPSNILPYKGFPKT